MAETSAASFRLPADLLEALRKHAEERGESFSDVLRRAALMVLGVCPTCGQQWTPEPPKAVDG